MTFDPWFATVIAHSWDAEWLGGLVRAAEPPRPYMRLYGENEKNHESFAAMVLKVKKDVVEELSDFSTWTLEIARIFHYYIHGKHGNGEKAQSEPLISVHMKWYQLQADGQPKETKSIDLKEIHDNFEAKLVTVNVIVLLISAQRDCFR